MPHLINKNMTEPTLEQFEAYCKKNNIKDIVEVDGEYRATVDGEGRYLDSKWSSIIFINNLAN